MRGAYTEHALSWESNVSCLRNAEYQIQNLLFCLKLLSRCFYTQEFWLCVFHSLSKCFRGKVLFLVRIVKSSILRIYFCGLQPTWRCFYTRVFWLCVVHTLNKRFRGKAMFLVCFLQSSWHRIYFCGLQPACSCFFTQVFWLSVVNSLNKRFRGKVMCLARTAKSSKHRIYFVASSEHVGAFTREHSGCALCIHWTSAFLGKHCDLFVQRKVPNTESFFFWHSARR